MRVQQPRDRHAPRANAIATRPAPSDIAPRAGSQSPPVAYLRSALVAEESIARAGWQYPPPARREAAWPAALTVLAAIGLQVALPRRLSVGPAWLIPALEGALLLGLTLATPRQLEGPHRRRRRVALTLAALVSLANAISLGALTHLLLHHNVTSGHELIVSGLLIWLTNFLIFALWYWELDRGGPGRRAAGEDSAPDFLFPQMSDDRIEPRDWRPAFIDYLYLSLTNAAAFSPTDTMPLSPMAKCIMGVQSIISLITIGLIVSRAVNIL